MTSFQDDSDGERCGRARRDPSYLTRARPLPNKPAAITESSPAPAASSGHGCPRRGALCTIGRVTLPRTSAFVVLTGVLLTAPIVRLAGTDDWSRFRGPNGTGISSSTGLPTEFGPEKNVVWKTAVPPGHSSPVLTATQIFLTAYEGDALLVLSLRPRDRPRAVAPRGAPHRQGTSRRPELPGVAVAGDRRRARLHFLPGRRAHRLHDRGPRAMARGARPVQHLLRLRRLAHRGGRHRAADGGSEHRLVPARGGCAHREDAIPDSTARE